MNFNLLTQKEIDNINVKVYSLNDGDIPVIREYLINKIRSMKIHSNLININIDDYSSPWTTRELLEQINTKTREEFSNPINAPIIPFDVRRSRVTEFMSHAILESQYNCLFDEKIDKRINLDFHERDKHVQGIDVTGFRQDSDPLKFVVCEVKASSEKKIPCSSSKRLYSDILHAYKNHDGRLVNEILNAITVFGNDTSSTSVSDEIANTIDFLISLLVQDDSIDEIRKSVTFFPFLIRNNPNIESDHEVKEFNSFYNGEITDSEIQGVIWSVAQDIDDFCRGIYQEALEDHE